MEAIKTLTSDCGRYKLRIYPDSCDNSPREWDNIGKIYAKHRRYNLSDKDCDIDSLLTDLDCFEDIEKFCYRENLLNEADGDCLEKYDLTPDTEIFRRYMEAVIEKRHVVLPVYMYEHSGVSIRTTSFNDNWDSGLVGYIVADRNAVLKEYSVTEITPELREKVLGVLRGEIDTYSKYLNGEIYGFRLFDLQAEEHEDDVDSCWGFYELSDILEHVTSDDMKWTNARKEI